MAILELEGIRRSYDREPALRGVSLSVEPGDVLGLVGCSGAGKTTLLRVAAALLKADEGRVAVFGLDPWKHSVEVKRRLGYVAEAQAVPPRLSARGLIDMHRDLFPSWDRDLERLLLERLTIPTKPRQARAVPSSPTRSAACSPSSAASPSTPTRCNNATCRPTPPG